MGPSLLKSFCWTGVRSASSSPFWNLVAEVAFRPLHAGVCSGLWAGAGTAAVDSIGRSAAARGPPRFFSFNVSFQLHSLASPAETFPFNSALREMSVGVPRDKGVLQAHVWDVSGFTRELQFQGLESHGLGAFGHLRPPGHRALGGPCPPTAALCGFPGASVSPRLATPSLSHARYRQVHPDVSRVSALCSPTVWRPPPTLFIYLF